MKTLAIKLVDALGHDVLVNEVGLTERNIRHIRSSGKFAAGLYRRVKEAAEPRGIFVPMGAFNFYPPAKKNGVSNGGLQEASGEKPLNPAP